MLNLKNAHVIYADAEEKYVKNVVLYVSSNEKLYYDAELTNAVNGVDLAELYLKGVVVSYAGYYCTPTGFVPDDSEPSIGVAMVGEDGPVVVMLTAPVIE